MARAGEDVAGAVDSLGAQRRVEVQGLAGETRLSALPWNRTKGAVLELMCVAGSAAATSLVRSAIDFLVPGP